MPFYFAVTVDELLGGIVLAAGDSA